MCNTNIEGNGFTLKIRRRRGLIDWIYIYILTNILIYIFLLFSFSRVKVTVLSRPIVPAITTTQKFLVDYS